MEIKVASTSITKNVMIYRSDTGAPLTGLAYNTASLTCYYVLPRAASVAVTLATQTVTGAYSSGGFVEIDATNCPGLYRFDIPNAALASGRWTNIHFNGAANMAPCVIEIDLTGWDNQDAVRGGMTALPNANAEAAGGLYTRGTGAGQINQDANGRIDVSLKAILGTTLTETAGQIAAAFKQFFDVASPTGTMKAITNVVTATNLTNAPTSGDFTSTMKTSIGTAVAASAVASVTGNVGGNVTGSVGSVASGGITAASIAASALNGKGDWNIGKTGYALSSAGVQAIWDALTSALTTVGSVGKLIVDNLNATITSRMASYTQPTGFLTATFPSTVASTTNITAGTITTVTNLTNAPTSGDFTATMKTSLNAATPSVTVSDKTGFALTAAYDAAKTAATQTSVDTVDTVVDAIKAKTDSLTFGVAGKVDANIKYVNDVSVTGTGTDVDPWNPA